MSLTDQNRPLRVFDKVLKGGLGAGNLGVIMSRHGTGKIAILTSIAIDHAMSGVNTLHAVLNKSVEEVRAYDDEVLNAMIASYGLADHAQVLSTVERHKQIYTWRDGSFSCARLKKTLEFLSEHAQFRPGLIELQGWPNLETIDAAEVTELKALAKEYECEVWMSAHTHRSDGDAEGIKVPEFLKRFENDLSVIVALEPTGDHVNVRFLKTHNEKPAEGVNLQFSPEKMLLRWH